MNPPKVNDLTLEKYVLGELSPSEQRRVHALTSDPEIAERVAKISQSNDQFLSEYSPEWALPILRQKMQPLRLSERKYYRPVLAFAALLLLAIPVSLTFMQNETGVRIKGAHPHISIYKKAGESFDKLSNDAAVKVGDTLQVSYIAADAKFGAIFSVDGTGKTTLHYPEKPGVASKLLTTGEVILPNAFQLDASPDFEKFVFVTSQNVFHTEDVIRALSFHKGEADPVHLNLPEGLKGYTVVLKK